MTKNQIREGLAGLFDRQREKALAAMERMDEECRTRVAKVVLSDDLEYVEAVVDAGKDDQPSQFHHRCAKLAQALYWARREGKVLDGVARKLLDAQGKVCAPVFSFLFLLLMEFLG